MTRFPVLPSFPLHRPHAAPLQNSEQERTGETRPSFRHRSSLATAVLLLVATSISSVTVLRSQDASATNTSAAAPAQSSDTSAAFPSGPTVQGHEMACLPPEGGATTLDDEIARMRRLKSYGVQIVNLFQAEIYDASVTQRVYDAAAAVGGIWVQPSFAFAYPWQCDAVVERLNQFASHPASARTPDGRLMVTTYHGSVAELRAIRAAQPNCLLVAQVFPRPVGTSLEAWDDAPVVGNYPNEVAWMVKTIGPLVDGFAQFFGNRGSNNEAAFLAEQCKAAGLLCRMSITPQYVPVGNGLNGDVEDGCGYEWMARQLEYACENRDQFSAIEFTTLNDRNEDTCILGQRDDFLVCPRDQYWDPYAAEQTRHNGYAAFAADYVTWFRTGVRPAIQGTRIFVAHRLHPASTLGEAAPYMNTIDWPRLVDAIFVTVRSDKTVHVTVNGLTQIAQAGETHLRFPFTLGTVKISADGFPDFTGPEITTGMRPAGQHTVAYELPQ